MDRQLVNRWDGGIGWIADPDERMERASQAIVGADGVWLVDPVDMPTLADAIADLGAVTGIVITLDRHARDAAALARRFDVAVHRPAPIDRSLDAPTRSIDAFSADTGFEPIPVVDLPGWREVALYDASGGTLVCADALGTAAHFRAPGERLGVHPALRPMPPRRALGGLAVDRVLVGHGPGIMADGTTAVQDALRGARRRAPRVYARALARLPGLLREWRA